MRRLTSLVLIFLLACPWSAQATWTLIETGNFAITPTTAQATIAQVPVNNLPVGTVVIIYCSAHTDNVAGSGASTVMGVSDAVGNGAYIRLSERGINNAAIDSITGIFYKQLTVALTTADPITCNTGDVSSEGKIIDITAFSVSAGSTVTQTVASHSSTTSTTYNSGAVSGLSNIERLWLGLVNFNHTSGAITCDTTFTCTSGRTSSTGTAGTSSIHQKAYRIQTSTGDTFDGTISASRVWGAQIVALEEVPSGSGAKTCPGSLLNLSGCKP